MEIPEYAPANDEDEPAEHHHIASDRISVCWNDP